MLTRQPTEQEYAQAFAKEAEQHYPIVDMFENNWGYHIDSARLLEAARVLACPVKANPPNWQHGRIVYSMLRVLLRRLAGETVNLIDIGTAKGFSALVMAWAVQDARSEANIFSCDVIDPDARVPRNTIADCDGLKTLHEILAQWPEAKKIQFRQLGGATFLSEFQGRVHFCFVDGKHKYESVRTEANVLRLRQESGDMVVFDDVQIPGVKAAIEELKGYQKDYLSAHAARKYCIAVRE